MKTIYYTAASLDGYIADRRNSLDWLLQFTDAGDSYATFIAGVGALVMGSTTYEWLLANHVRPNSADPKSWPYDFPAWVLSSRTLPPCPGFDIRFASGDVRRLHPEMMVSAGGKNLWVAGGGGLAGQFFDAGLLDEINVQVAPVTLGGGAPLLPREIVKPPLRLVSVRILGGAFAELKYETKIAEDSPAP